MSELQEVIVGVIGKPHGIRGAVMVEPRTDEPERRFAPGAVLRQEDTERRYTVGALRWQGQRMVVEFAELTDRDAAEAARGTVLVADVAGDEVPEDPEEFYDRHLMGLRVLDHRGSEVGTVTAVQHPPTQDLLVVATEAGERYIPFTVALVPDVDLKAGTCTLADVPGLIDDAVDDA